MLQKHRKSPPPSPPGFHTVPPCAAATTPPPSCLPSRRASRACYHELPSMFCRFTATPAPMSASTTSLCPGAIPCARSQASIGSQGRHGLAMEPGGVLRRHWPGGVRREERFCTVTMLIYCNQLLQILKGSNKTPFFSDGVRLNDCCVSPTPYH